MTEKQLDEFAPFWSSEAKNYVLVNMEPASDDLRYCGIVNRRYKSIVLIENAELALEVMQRMVDAGVEIVDKLPDCHC